MVTVHRERGFRFVIYLNDHSPAHVHAFNGDGEAKINLDPVELVSANRLNRNEIRAAMTIVEAQQREFLAQWSKIHGAPNRQ